ncbi:MAG: hypothetical protein GX874_11470 [Smithella sp.]|jgi:hypothetical protein|nr:hypothetical protein [Smithellaceae bacterium]NLA41999.1 hypothetical protein [Smithella sp.]
MKLFYLKITAVFALLLFAAQAWAWHDKTHLMIAKAAGRTSWYNAAGPDLAKIKAGNIEEYNHWYNNNAEAEVTVMMVMDQVGRYNQRNKLMDSEGHVYGAIIASLRAYNKAVQSGKYAEYHLDYCVHYIGDLSQPLHNIPYDDYNKKWHRATDGVVENTIWNEADRITAQMYEIRLSAENLEADLAREIARIANISRRLGYRLRAEKRGMTREEAFEQMGHSASLIRAVLRRYH